MTKAITIGVPVFNGAEYLDGALESLSAQTFTDYEIVISDNASSDETPQIIEKWKVRNPRISSYRQQSNIGALANFEWVLRQAKSRWFMFAAHDDLWSPNHLGTMYASITARPGLGCAVPATIQFLTNGKQFDPVLVPDSIIAGKKGLGVLRHLLDKTHCSWFYGLYDRDNLIAAYGMAKRCGFVWGADYIALLPFALSNSITGDNGAIFYQRLTPASVAAYKPRTLPAQASLYRAFLRETMRCLKCAPL